jgi:hypothetical protein
MENRKQLQTELRSAIQRCDVKKVEYILNKNNNIKQNSQRLKKPKMNTLINALFTFMGKKKTILNEKRGLKNDCSN